MVLSILTVVSMLSATPCESIGEKAERLMRANQPVLAGLLDVEAMTELVLKHQPEASESYKKSWRTQLISALPNRLTQEDTQLYAATNNGQNFAFLRCQKDVQAEWALFRLVLGEAGFNYLRLRIAPNHHVVDYDTLQAGMSISAQLGSVFQQAVAVEDKSFLQRLTHSQKQKHLLQDVNILKTARELTVAKKGSEALEKLASLSEGSKHSRIALELQVQAASLLGVEDNYTKYTQAVEAFEKAFPGDASLALKKIDVYFVQEKWKEVLEAVDQLDRAIGGDDYLELLRGNVYLKQNQPQKAIEAYRRALVATPKTKNVHYSLIGALLAIKKNKELSQAIDELEKQTGVTMDVADADLFMDFRKSPEGKEWLKAHKN